MTDLLNVSSTPHVRQKDTTSNIMFDVVIALLPATAFGIYRFKLDAFLVILVSVIAAVATEFIYQKLMHKKNTITDGSALVTGLLLALNMPSTIPLWIPALGSIFAILVVKLLFGGLGQNFMNPALAARCFLLISFPGKMISFPLDAVTTATPLALVKSGESVDVLQMFIGNISGTIGEVSVIMLLIGALYLVARKVISLRIPLAYIGSFLVFILLFSGKGLDIDYILAQLCGGGLMLGAFFMATDYVTSPITPNGKILFGIFIGILTGIFRLFGGSAEGVSYAIIIGNLIVPLIEKITLPKAFGKEKIQHGKN